MSRLPPHLATLNQFLRSASETALLFRNTAGSFGVNVISNGLLFGAQILFANWLGVDGFGVYVLALAWMNVLLLVGRQGFDIATVRFVAAYTASQDWSGLRGFLRASTGIVFAGSAIVSLGLAVFCLFAGDILAAGTRHALLIVCGIVPFFALLQIKAAALRGFGNVVLADIPHSVIHPALLILLPLCAVTLFGHEPTPQSALWAYLVSLVFSLAAVWLLMIHLVPAAARHAVPAYRLRKWVLAAPAMMLIAGFGVVLNQIGVIMLGVITTPDEAGLFGAGSRVAWTLQLIVFALVTASASRIVFGLALLAAALLLVMGEWVLGWFGSEFAAAYTVMAILLVGQLAWAANAPAGIILNMTGRHNESALILGASIVVNVTLSTILIPSYGADGAAIANSATIVLWNVATAVGVYRWLGMRSWVWIGDRLPKEAAA